MNERLLVLVMILGATFASAQPVTETDVARLTTEQNPSVRAAKLDVDRASQAVRAQEARYRPSLLLDGTGTSQNTPNLTVQGGTMNQLNQVLTFGAELSQTFSFGTTVGVRLENRNTRTEGPLFAGSTDTFSLGPGYGLSARLSVTQPLLRGFGNGVGLSALRDELLSKSRAELQRTSTASQKLSDALQAYWEVWYAARAVEIQRSALALAQEQRDAALKKLQAGSLADVDVLSFESRVAELEQNLVAAETTLNQRAVDLNVAMGAGSLTLPGAPADAPAVPEPVDTSATLTRALEASYQVLEARASLEQAQNQTVTAGDATRARLDVTGWVQTQGLGNTSFERTFDQLGRFSNVSANVGLVFELPLSGERHDAQVQQANVAVLAATERLTAAQLEVEGQAKKETDALAQARRNVALARRSAEVAQRSQAAQRERFQKGASTALEVREAEDTARRTQLSVERERVNAVKSRIRLWHLTGELLPRYLAE